MLFKKGILISLVALVSLGFVACTSSQPKDASKDATPKENSSASTEKVKLTVWAMGEEAKKMDEIVKPFEERTGYDVEVQAIPWAEAHTKLLTAVASKSGPDVIQLGTTWMPEFIDATAIADLTPYIEKHANIKPDRFYEGSNLTTHVDNKMFGVPMVVDTRVLFYRTDILESVGYSEAPKTWEELKDASAKLRARGSDFYGMNWDLKDQSLIFMLANQQGAKYYGTDYDKNFNTPQFKEATEYVLPFIKNEESLTDASINVIQGFSGDGVLPMFIGGPWMVSIINDEAPEIKGKWATAVLPKGSSNNDSILGGSNLTVFAFSKNIDKSVEFLDFMCENETQNSWFKATNALPGVKLVWDDIKELKDDPLFVTFGKQLETAKPMPLTPKFEEIAQKWILEFEKIYRNNDDVTKTIESFNTQAEKIFSE